MAAVTGALALGGNTGDVRRTFREALIALRRAGVAIERVSPLFRARAWGEPDQPDYLNAAARVRAELSAPALLRLLQRVEAACGRAATRKKNAPRPLDLDLIFWGDEVRTTPRLTLPHPRWRERDFVVVPLAAVLPAAERKQRRWPRQCRYRQIVRQLCGPSWANGLITNSGGEAGGAPRGAGLDDPVAAADRQ